MKRLVVLTGFLLLAPSVAQAQLPVAPPPERDAPQPAPAAPIPAAAVQGSPASAPTDAPAAAPAPHSASEAPPAPPPGDEYYVDPAPPPSAPAPPAAEPPPFEPPPPPVLEPPPPPLSGRVASERSLWLGGRVGWFVPFGNVWARAAPIQTADGTSYLLNGVPWSDYAASGPMLELDVGVRFARSYTAFALWERAQLRSGSVENGPDGEQNGAESDFWALGLRASSDPDRLGFVTEVAIGYRRARTFFANDVQYQFTDAPFEARLGIGAELRLSPLASLSGLVTVGVGGFGKAERVGPDGAALSLLRSIDDSDGHAWATINVGGHFDLLRSRD